jgi:2-polyprenyl-3-methyl-5-hydroxy-6-metoxy-1,4-benzoquinol methylase
MNQTTEEARLTDEDFWERHWAFTKVPARVRWLASFDRCLIRLFQKFLGDGQGKKLIEIGAAPGRWLIFFREKLGYEVDGIEYLASACRKTEENMSACGVPGQIFQQDFFQNDLPRHSYDVVLSIGFIEHFTNLDPVIAGHIALLKPGGKLVLIVPNLQGINGAVMRRTDHAFFSAHNLETMTLPFLEELAVKYDMTPLWIGHMAGITPGLSSIADDNSQNKIKQLRIKLLRLGFPLLRYLRSALVPLDYMNGPFISGFLMGIYQYTPQKAGGEVSAGSREN